MNKNDLINLNTNLKFLVEKITSAKKKKVSSPPSDVKSSLSDEILSKVEDQLKAFNKLILANKKDIESLRRTLKNSDRKIYRSLFEIKDFFEKNQEKVDFLKKLDVSTLEESSIKTLQTRIDTLEGNYQSLMEFKSVIDMQISVLLDELKGLTTKVSQTFVERSQIKEQNERLAKIEQSFNDLLNEIIRGVVEKIDAFEERLARMEETTRMLQANLTTKLTRGNLGKL